MRGIVLHNIVHSLKSSIHLRVEGGLEQIFVFSSSRCSMHSPWMSYTCVGQKGADCPCGNMQDSQK
eukprot:1147892-Pelagomonas_calceolata.AAC.3